MRNFFLKKIVPVFIFAFWFGASPAHADDWGCQVLLCLSNPNGPTAVAECVDPINKLWKELAKGHDFPTCTFAPGPNGESAQSQAANNYGGNQWASGTFCPPQYTYIDSSTTLPYCTMTGAVSVVVNGQPWTRIWWNGSTTKTEYSGGAGQKSSGTQGYDADYAVWYQNWKRQQEEATKFQN